MTSRTRSGISFSLKKKNKPLKVNKASIKFIQFEFWCVFCSSACRTVWWSSGATPGEVLGSDGEPEGEESWLRLSPSLRGLPAEVSELSFSCPTAAACSVYLRPDAFRYKPLCPETWPSWPGQLEDGVSTLVNHLGYKAEEFKLGR